MKRGVIALGLIAAVSLPLHAQDVALDTDLQKFSYAVGQQIGGQMIQQGLTDIDVDAFAAALKDRLAGRDSRVTPDEARAAAQAMRAKLEAKRAAGGGEAKAKGMAFMAENGKKEGIMTTDSGLQYKVHKAGEGASPVPESQVVVHYTGKLLDGSVFDSSFERGEPAEFGVGQVIPGWQEALQLMKAGAQYEVWIPAELGYGPSGAGAKIGPNETLHFLISLIEIKQ